eukprot:255116_1
MIGISYYLRFFRVLLSLFTRTFGSSSMHSSNVDGHTPSLSKIHDANGTETTIALSQSCTDSAKPSYTSCNTDNELNEPYKQSFDDDAIYQISRTIAPTVARSRRAMSAPTANQSKDLFFTNLKHKSIAAQLTLIMHDIYTNIPFHYVQMHKDYYTKRYTQIFNQIVSWIQYSILIGSNSKERAKTIKKWIKTCDYLLELKNFH